MTDVAAAFADGRLWLIIDEPRPMHPNREIAFEGDVGLRSANHRLTIVHVMSKPAGGEIRGYVLVDDETDLRVRRPNYTGDWLEMDAEVRAAISKATGSEGAE